MNRNTKQNRRARRISGGFTMIELLIAVVLLSISVAAMTRMWSLSRNLTGQNQNSGETYSVARQEIERDKNVQFNALFIDNGVSLGRVTDYTQAGTPIATSLANVLNINVVGLLTISSPPTASAFYRAVSTYSLVNTGSETDLGSFLGVQTVKIYRVNGSAVDTSAPVYQTSEFYSTAGI